MCAAIATWAMHKPTMVCTAPPEACSLADLPCDIRRESSNISRIRVSVIPIELSNSDGDDPVSSSKYHLQDRPASADRMIVPMIWVYDPGAAHLRAVARHRHKRAALRNGLQIDGTSANRSVSAFSEPQVFSRVRVRLAAPRFLVQGRLPANNRMGTEPANLRSSHNLALTHYNLLIFLSYTHIHRYAAQKPKALAMPETALSKSRNSSDDDIVSEQLDPRSRCWPVPTSTFTTSSAPLP